MLAANTLLVDGQFRYEMIHDDFGVHACHVDRFQEIIREQFVALHEVDLLRNFKEVHEERTGLELPELPDLGTLDIKDVLRSPYFFG